MLTVGDDEVEVSFQWAVGDLRALEKNLIQIGRSKHHQAVGILSRIIAFGLTALVSYALLPEVDFSAVLLIALAGSYSIWASWAVSIFAFRSLEKLMAKDNRRVGWNTVWFDRSGVTWNTETSHEYTSWLGVSDVVQRDSSIWIKTGPAHGYFLPGRVFKTADQMEECLKLIQDFRNRPLPPRHTREAETDLVKH